MVKKIKNIKQKFASDWVNLELTYRCNLRCKMCGLWKTNQLYDQKELNTGQWKRVITDLTDMGKKRFSLIGAEPFLRKDIFDIIEHIKSLNATCSITTNGLLLNPDRVQQLVKMGIETIILSVDGPPAIHDSIRGRTGSFRKLYTGAMALKAEIGRAGVNKPVIVVNTTVSTLNVCFLKAIVDCVKDFADRIRIQYISETNDRAVKASQYQGECIALSRFNPLNGSLLLKKDQLESLKKEMTALQADYDSANIDARFISGLSEKTLLTGQFPLKMCRIVKNRLIINPYGDVYPCAHLNYHFGHIEKGIHNILTSPVYQRFVEHLEKDLFPVCQYCCHHAFNLTKGQMLKLAILKRL